MYSTVGTVQKVQYSRYNTVGTVQYAHFWLSKPDGMQQQPA